MEHEAWNSSDELECPAIRHMADRAVAIERELITACESIDSFGPRREWTD